MNVGVVAGLAGGCTMLLLVWGEIDISMRVKRVVGAISPHFLGWRCIIYIVAKDCRKTSGASVPVWQQ